MKRRLRLAVVTTTAVVLAASAMALAAPVTADSAYRIRMFGCADGAPGFNLVPADTPLFVQAGWLSGTKGLVQSAINNTTTTVANLHAGTTTVYDPVWGPIEPFAGGGWIAIWRVDLPPLALGDKATVTMSQSLGKPQVDIGLPTKDDDHSGLQYFARAPAGLTPLGGEPNPTICTVTAI